MAKWPWRSRSLTLFSIPAETISRCKYSANLAILDEIHYEFFVWTSQISQNSDVKWPKWPWRSRSMAPICNTSQVFPRLHLVCKFGDSSPYLWQLFCRQSKFPIILSKWPWCLLVAILVIPAHICDELSCRQGKVYRQMDGGTDAWTDRQMQAMTITLHPERPKGWNWSVDTHVNGRCNAAELLIDL